MSGSTLAAPGITPRPNPSTSARTGTDAGKAAAAGTPESLARTVVTTASMSSLLIHRPTAGCAPCKTARENNASVSRGSVAQTARRMRGTPASAVARRLICSRMSRMVFACWAALIWSISRVPLRLHRVQARVGPAPSEQGLVATSLGDAAVLQDHDEVGHAHGGEAVADQ